jgi:hypothetical protein
VSNEQRSTFDGPQPQGIRFYTRRFFRSLLRRVFFNRFNGSQVLKYRLDRRLFLVITLTV